MLIEDSFIYDLPRDILEVIAKCESTPLKVLEKLAKNGCVAVRFEVASNPNTPQLVLIGLAADEYYIVRAGVASNSNTPHDTLFHLSKDKSFTVCKALVKNPNAPFNTLENILNNSFLDYASCSSEFDVINLHILVRNHPNYKPPANHYLSSKQLEALKTLITASSDPHLKELFNGISE
jgi:hypothetical protein